MKKENYIAHRGLFDNEKIPENSMKAFKKAVDNGFSIELDVQLTKDNILVVFHDEDLFRMTGVNGLIQEKTYDEIAKLKLLNTNESIPVFSDVLKLIKGKVLLDIEIKNTKRIKKTCDLLMMELDGYKPFIIKSFYPKIVRYLKKNYKDIEVGLLLTSKYKHKIYKWFMLSNILLGYCKPDFLAVSKKLLNTKRMNKLEKKYPIMVWTIKNKNEIDNESNLTYICNNLPFK